MPQHEGETLADRALMLRKGLGLTRPELARRIGVTPTHVYHVETGRRRKMRPETLERYAAALEVTPQFLEYGQDPTPNPSDSSSWPTVSVLLRHTSPLGEDEIRQVERFVQALEMQHQMEDLAQARVTDMSGKDVEAS